MEHQTKNGQHENIFENIPAIIFLIGTKFICKFFTGAVNCLLALNWSFNGFKNFHFRFFFGENKNQTSSLVPKTFHQVEKILPYPNRPSIKKYDKNTWSNKDPYIFLKKSMSIINRNLSLPSNKSSKNNELNFRLGLIQILKVVLNKVLMIILRRFYTRTL